MAAMKPKSALGPSALFGFIAAVYCLFLPIILYRMQVRTGVPADDRGRFVALLRTSTIFAKLVRGTGKERRGGGK